MNADKTRVALITGAGSGIGAAAARLFAERGERVVAADVNEEGGAATVAAIEQAGGEAIFVRADVSNSAEVEAMVTAAVERFGRLDHAFNNAGIEGAPAPLADLDEAAWDHLIAVNLKSVFLCMKSEIPAMLANGGGAIVNTSSVAGLVGFAGSAAYVASKHGVVGLTKSAALDYAAAGVRINAVCPGVIETPMITRALAGQPALEAGLKAAEPVGRFGAPVEIAEAAHWLCSDASSFLTAQAIAVDGGFTAQ